MRIQERLVKLRDALTRSRKTFGLAHVSEHLRNLPPSDKLIAAVLALLIVVTSVWSIRALMGEFLVTVPAYGGSLVEGVVGSPRFVHPLLAITDADKDLVALTYAGLMGYDKDGALTPVLAESYTVGEDGKTYTFTLRSDARFSDGSPVTAEDVVFTVRKAQDPSLKSPELSNWANILVEAVDARTVRFSLPKAYAPFLEDATLGILPAHLWRSVATEEFPFSSYTSTPVGAGPFEVTNVVRNTQGVVERYELRSFSGYAGGKPYLSSITLLYFKTAEDLAEAVMRGRVESAHSVPSVDGLHTSYARVFGVFFNQNKNPLFARKEVREALSQALDRTALTEEVLGGFATPLWGPVPPYSTVPLLTLPSGIEEARTTLTDAGWEQSEETGTWTLPDESLTLTLTIKTSTVPELRAIAEQVRTDWEALGVPVTLEFFEPADLVQSVIRPREYDALLFGMVLGPNSDLFAFWESSQRNDPGLNIAMYANKRVDDLLEIIRSTTDEGVKVESLQEVNELIAADFPAAFTHAPDFVYHIPNDVRGVVLPSIREPKERFNTVAFWHRYTDEVWPFFVEADLNH